MNALSRRLIAALGLLGLLGLGACGGSTPDEQEPSCTDGVLNGTETDVDCGGDCSACLDEALCVADADCVSGYCGEGACALPTCDDGVLNGAETDVDCGGADCSACGAGKSCSTPSDCLSGDCTAGACRVAPSCTDGSLNGAETDIDCGGTLCDPCADGEACGAGTDCASGVCEGEVCAPAPTCGDDVQNGGESDVDCGGPDCDACADGWTCTVGSDCSSGVCEGGVCQAAPACDDGVQNGDESDVDCGGSCAGCADGKKCGLGDDCVNGTCEAGLCVTVDPCSNGVQDGTETDVDCGGDSCEACPDGWGCETVDDCQGAGFILPLCEGGMCGGSYMCDDMERDGKETDVDCGGGLCRPCAGGLSCESNDDCMSGECVDGACTAQADTCANGVKDGYETDVDCGGPCEPCRNGWLCDYDSDCFCEDETGCDWWFCDENVCGGMDMCYDEVQNGHETDVDCGGSACLPCRQGGACTADADCGSLDCTDGVCVGLAADCGDGQQNGYETDVDCGGRGCVVCNVGQSCALDEDCSTGFCDAGTCAYNIISLQQSPESLTCAASGVTTVNYGVQLQGLVVASPALEIDADTQAFWLAQPLMTWPTFGDPSFTGILAVVDRTVSVGVQPGDEVDVVGDHEEWDCETVLRIRAPMGSMTTTRTGLSPMPAMLLPTAFENGGSEATEPYEGTLVRLNNLTVSDASGYAGPEGPGQPHWWAKVGNGIYVANDFGLTKTLLAGDVLSKLVGVVVYRHGMFLIVPRSDDDVGLK